MFCIIILTLKLYSYQHIHKITYPFIHIMMIYSCLKYILVSCASYSSGSKLNDYNIKTAKQYGRSLFRMNLPIVSRNILLVFIMNIQAKSLETIRTTCYGKYLLQIPFHNNSFVYFCWFACFFLKLKKYCHWFLNAHFYKRD